MSKELNGLIKKLQAKAKRQYDQKKKKEPPPAPSTTGILSDEQIENWRKVLCMQLGPYAFIMPREDIQRLRDKMQRMADNFPKDFKDAED